MAAKSPGNKMKDHLVMENYVHTKYLVEWIDNVTNEMGSLRKYVGELQGEIKDLKEKDQQNQMEIVELMTNVKINNEQLELLNELMKIENKSTKEEINKLQKEDEMKIQVEISELRKKSKDQSRQIDEWKKKCDDTKQVADENDLETSKKIERFSARSDQSDESIKQMKIKSENIDRKMFEMEKNLAKLNHGEFVWIIENISNKIKRAKDGITTKIFSDASYSHKNGYKMCLGMCPNGFGDGEGSHLSLYFYLMKGQFDDILSWPFEHDVMFSLMNQRYAIVHVSKTLKYSADFDKSRIFMKPINNRNSGLGCPQFIRHDELLSNSALIKNNQIIIKCSLNI